MTRKERYLSKGPFAIDLTAGATIVTLVVQTSLQSAWREGRVELHAGPADTVLTGHLKEHYTLGGTAGSQRGPAVYP